MVPPAGALGLFAACALATPVAPAAEPGGPPVPAAPDAPNGGGDGEAVRFEYSAPAGCPEAGFFEALVREKSSRARDARDGELARVFRVLVSREEEGASARLEFVDRDGAPIARAVRGESCEETVRAIALVTALAIDAQLGEPEEPAPPAASPPAPPPARAPAAPPAEPERPEAAEPAERAARVELALSGSARSFQGPGLAFGGGLGARFLFPGGVSAGLAFEWVTSSTSVARPDAPALERGADFVLLGGRAELCPVEAPLLPSLSLWPCAAIGLGRLEGSGQASAALSPARSSAIFWADALFSLRLGWVLEDFLLLSLAPELGLPLVRHEFVADGPRQRVFAVPGLGGGVSLGVGLRFH